MRGLAAFAVLIFHYTWQYPRFWPHPGMVKLPSFAGSYGVEFFFGISGFVILMSLTRTVNVADFLVSRFSRLYPAYWVGIILTTLAVVLAGLDRFQIAPWQIGVNLTMLQGHLLIPHVETAYWSLDPYSTTFAHRDRPEQSAGEERSAVA